MDDPPKRKRAKNRKPGDIVGLWCLVTGSTERTWIASCTRCGRKTTASAWRLVGRPCPVCDGVRRGRIPGPRVMRGGNVSLPRHVEREARGLPDLSRAAHDESPETLAQVCELVYDRGPMTLDDVGLVLGVSREMVRQIEQAALAKLATACRKAGLSVEDARSILGRGEPTLPDHGVPLSNHTHITGYIRAVREENAAPPPDCEPGEPMAAACLDELGRLERRMRAVHAALDAARELALPVAAE
jgi:hypothetical protein